MMGFGEEGEKGPFPKRAFSPPQVTTFIGNRAENKKTMRLHCMMLLDEIIRMMIGMTDDPQAELAGLGKITINQLISLNRLKNCAILVTDKASAYRKYDETFGFDLIQLKSGKEYKVIIFHKRKGFFYDR